MMRSCSRIKTLLALWVGRDLEERGISEVRLHLADCPKCREHWQNLQTGQAVLAHVSAARPSPEEAGPSVWPSVYSRMMQRPVTTPRSWSWLPAGALAAACVGLVFVTQFSSPGPGPQISPPVRPWQNTTNVGLGSPAPARPAAPPQQWIYSQERDSDLRSQESRPKMSPRPFDVDEVRSF